MESKSDSYKAAGVDITAGYESVKLIKEHIKRTAVPGANLDIGGFGGMFAPNFSGMQEPVLVSGCDGVGTKLKIAFLMDKHDTVGIDCVAMCVNDILCAGAKPLFFLDYIALGKNVPEKVASIVGGIAEGCVRAGCALIGGETAEMPGFYREGEYDLAGFAVGMAEKRNILSEKKLKAGDILVALPSSGVHSNGFSLVRKVFELENGALDMPLAEYSGKTLGEVLLTPTEIYVGPVLALLEQIDVLGIAHITGGGLYENIPRSLKKGLSARISKKALRIPPIFGMISAAGNVPERDMYNTFNMGVGMTVAVRAADAENAVRILRQNGVEAFAAGEIFAGEEGVLMAD